MVLAIDTAGPVICVAAVEVSQGEGGRSRTRLCASWAARLERGAEARLVPAIESALGGAVPSAIAVVTGPGAFTGIRVGVATALGLAQAYGVTVVPLSALQVRAGLAPGHPCVLSLLDARKGRFYAGCFDTTHASPVLLGSEGDLPIEATLPEQPFVAVGEGAEVSRAFLESHGGRVVPGADRGTAEVAGFLGAQGWLDGRAFPPASIVVRYLRPADAQPRASRPGGIDKEG